MQDKKKQKSVPEAATIRESDGEGAGGVPATLPVVINHEVKIVDTRAHKPADSESDEERGNSIMSHPILKIIPVKDAVLFPHNVVPFTSIKEWSSDSVERVVRIGGTVGILTQKSPDEVEEPSTEDLYTVGTEARILKIMRFPDNTYGAVVQGVRRFRVLEFTATDSGKMSARVEFFGEDLFDSENLEAVALGKAMKQQVLKAIALSPNIPREANLFIENVHDPAYLADLVMPYLSIDTTSKQAILEIEDLETRLRRIHQLLSREIEILEISQKINSEVKSEVSKQQRKYYVREQMKVLQKELGELDGKNLGGGSLGGSSQADPADFQERIQNSKMTAEVKEAALREVERMNMMQPGAPEYMVSHTYLTWLLDLPWGFYTHDLIDLKKSQEILDADHFGLEKIKKRILEFLAVCILKKSLKGPILLFVGPPGVGKTSLGKSIARAMGRKFTRIALGGVRDEAEIRGHRRTYIGSMPGKIIDAMKKAGAMDPVILLDEIDKLAYDGRGDPASALLEVLDPEQNHHFVDHYLSVPFDLSKVFFIATANSLQSIPAPLRDRMEVVELTSYTLEEKARIAFDHLLPQVMEEHGLTGIVDVKIVPETMKSLIRLYTRESGVRQLKRELAAVIRHVAKEVVEAGIVAPSSQEDKETSLEKEAKTSALKNESVSVREITLDDVRKFLGPAIFSDKKRPGELPVGVATGLAWTPHGGDVLYIETASSSPGSGKFGLTGMLGDVMKESVQTAFAYIRSNARQCGVDARNVSKRDIHIHFPEGAVKKDGPSAGVAAFLGMVSQFTGRALASDLAMTGEISLRGEVLPVGGIKEKLLAAHRYGIKQVLIPTENQRDLEDVPAEVLKEIKVLPVSTLDEVMGVAFGKKKAVRKTTRTRS